VARYRNWLVIGLAALGVFVIMQRPTESAHTVRDGVLTLAHSAGNLLQFAVDVGRPSTK
jgi:hypothetical protein